MRAAAAAPWPEPTATAIAGDAVGLDGWSPRPTQDPLNYELFKRQVGDRTCGYREGKRSMSRLFTLPKGCHMVVGLKIFQNSQTEMIITVQSVKAICKYAYMS